jgi:hypothetical protein
MPEMTQEELSRYIYASSWRKVQEVLDAIRRSADPRAELERLAPSICHPRVDQGRLPPLLLDIVGGLAGARK